MATKLIIKTKKIVDPTKISRGSWGSTNPVQRVEKSKRAYTRKNKSWKKEE